MARMIINYIVLINKKNFFLFLHCLIYSRSKFFHAYGNVTIANEGLQKSGLSSMFLAFD